MAHQVTLEEAASHLPELVREMRGGQEIVFTEGQKPVAKLVPVGEDARTASEIARLAMEEVTFNWMADESKLYSEKLSARVPALLRQWQQEYGLPPRPDGKVHTSVEELIGQWNREDEHLTPEEADAERLLREDHEKNHQKVSL